MRRMGLFALWGFLGLFLICTTTFAQNLPASETGERRFEAPFPSGGHLRLEVQSGDIRITGSDDQE